MKVNSRKTNENPFYQQRELLVLNQTGSKPETSKESYISLLNSAWRASKESKQLREMFFTIIFGHMDITDRQHSIFGKSKVDGGGNSLRNQAYWAVEWMLSNCVEQYYNFLMNDVIRQYSSIFTIVRSNVATRKGTKSIKNVLDMIAIHDTHKLAEYYAKIIRGSNPVEKQILAKSLVRVRKSRRQKRNKLGELVLGGRNLQSQTLEINKNRENFYRVLSEIMNWEVIEHPHNAEFKGMNEWKKEFNQDLESVLFSTGKIIQFDEQQFAKWLNTLPAGARYRVRRRLLDKDNNLKGRWRSIYGGQDIGQWFLNWEKFKEQKQQEQRELTEKVRQGTASEEDKKQLAKVKKEAKVTVGGNTLYDSMMKLYNANEREAEILITSILDKSKFEVPVLTITDTSGSMGGLPSYIASLVTTVAMLKNPSDDIDNLLVTFDNYCKIITDNSKVKVASNRFMQSKYTMIDKLVDRTQSFMANFRRIRSIVQETGGATNIQSVAKTMREWVMDDPNPSIQENRKEWIRSYPVFLILSDGDFNSRHTQASSIQSFKNDMLQYFGWDGVLCIWDIVDPNGWYANEQHNPEKFAHIENVIHYHGLNISTVNTIFANIHDLDIIDIYTELLSLYRSNRYDIVRQFVL